MTDPDFTDELRSLIQETIPTLDAAELLLLLAQHRDRPYSVRAIIEAMKPTAVSESTARRYLQQFESRGLVSPCENESYQYAAVTPELEAAVRALTRVYNERPVTLVRMIYSLKDEKIRSFADAFRLKK
jgi:DNA-binding MarR family transcriptional regulator